MFLKYGGEKMSKSKEDYFSEAHQILLSGLRLYLSQFPETKNAPDKKPIDKADRQDLLGRIIGAWDRVFDAKLPKIVRSYVHELKEVRNMDAHDEPLTLDFVRRYIDTLYFFLAAIKSPEETSAKKLMKKIQEQIQNQKNSYVSPLLDTLYVIQCSSGKGKESITSSLKGDIFEGLSEKTAEIFREMREKRMDQAILDRNVSYPAFKGYQGITYRHAEKALQDAVAEGGHILIVSGVYGLVRATETINKYEDNFRYEDWNQQGKSILNDVLVEYLQHFKIKHLRLFFTKDTSYSEVANFLGPKVNFLDSAFFFSFPRLETDKYVHLKNTGVVLKEILLGGQGNIEDLQALNVIQSLTNIHSLEIRNLLNA